MSMTDLCLTFVMCISAVVFGKVVEGMLVVKRMEMCGSKSGKVSRKVVISESGEVSLMLISVLSPSYKTAIRVCGQTVHTVATPCKLMCCLHTQNGYGCGLKLA